MQDVFMTGGAGFLGRAILRWAAALPDSPRFTIYSRDEAKQSEARRHFPDHRYVLGDVRDYDRLELAMAGHDTVIHAAAMKYVPQGETNVSEAIAVNVDGSLNVAKAAIRNRVERVLGISTDKACRPVNVYGMTKLLMERIFQEHDGLGDTAFTLVRYGNVLGSTGSVVPMFQRQAREGRITLTNAVMTRFWLSLKQAVDLVAWALQKGTYRGLILIPRLPACSMGVVAAAVAELEVGAKKAKRLEYVDIGQRFGEKVHEELLSPVEVIYTYRSDPLMFLHPVTGGVFPGHVDDPYTSNTPDRSLNKTQFMAMVQKAGEE